MKEKKDYELLYYNEFYKNKKLMQENKYLKEELELLKKYSKKGDIKLLIMEELKRYKKVK